jgi:Cu+-exporting ATPase
MEGIKTANALNTVCYHCGESCPDNNISINEKRFCCAGCKLVYEILNENSLCRYYSIEEHPGITLKNKVNGKKFSYLDNKDISSKLTEFAGRYMSVLLYIPSIHCSSCIWLLENLAALNSGIVESRVNFLNKTVRVKYNPETISLRKIAELLSDIGYEPEINSESADNEISKKITRSLYYKIGVAGFCFGNIMLLSFPEYLSPGGHIEAQFKLLFGFLNIILSLPVLIYSASDYYISSFKAARHKMVNLDMPIFFGLVVLFSRSLYEILSGTGAGYLDSMTGLVFFLLIGKVFQNKTYKTLNFERKYKSYFPLAVTVKKNGAESPVPIADLKPGHRIVVKNNELIPADSILFGGEANIDYSFVTGESEPVKKVLGEMIYAGGRQKGTTIELEVIRDVSQSYLTGLWNNEAFTDDDENRYTRLSDIVAKYFIYFIFISSGMTLLYWMINDPSRAFNAFTAVLIVACPCALALSYPFTLGNLMRIFGKNSFYVKNAPVIEKLSGIDTIVLDKTGTITTTAHDSAVYMGNPLTEEEMIMVNSLTRSSAHPLSACITKLLASGKFYAVEHFKEEAGRGLSGYINGTEVKIGSAGFVAPLRGNMRVNKTRVYVSIGNGIKGYYEFSNSYRNGIKQLFEQLGKKYELYLLSGDNDSEKARLEEMLGKRDNLFFNQTPQDKLNFIKNLQSRGKKVLMIGDGLNDAGALVQSNAGIAVTEDVNNFFPASSALMRASVLGRLGDILTVSGAGMKIVLFSFLFSFLYNVGGFAFAFYGNLSPLIAAILMPLSSITTVLISVGASNFISKKERLL